jgi:hypothetical protein
MKGEGKRTRTRVASTLRPQRIYRWGRGARAGKVKRKTTPHRVIASPLTVVRPFGSDQPPPRLAVAVTTPRGYAVLWIKAVPPTTARSLGDGRVVGAGDRRSGGGLSESIVSMIATPTPRTTQRSWQVGCLRNDHRRRGGEQQCAGSGRGGELARGVNRQGGFHAHRVRAAKARPVHVLQVYLDCPGEGVLAPLSPFVARGQ